MDLAPAGEYFFYFGALRLTKLVMGNLSTKKRKAPPSNTCQARYVAQVIPQARREIKMNINSSPSKSTSSSDGLVLLDFNSADRDVEDSSSSPGKAHHELARSSCFRQGSMCYEPNGKQEGMGIQTVEEKSSSYSSVTDKDNKVKSESRATFKGPDNLLGTQEGVNDSSKDFYSVFPSSTVQHLLRELIEKYISLDISVRSAKETDQYFCILSGCNQSVDAFSMMGHVVSNWHLQKFEQSMHTVFELEEKARVLSEIKSVKEMLEPVPLKSLERMQLLLSESINAVKCAGKDGESPRFEQCTVSAEVKNPLGLESSTDVRKVIDPIGDKITSASTAVYTDGECQIRNQQVVTEEFPVAPSNMAVSSNSTDSVPEKNIFCHVNGEQSQCEQSDDSSSTFTGVEEQKILSVHHKGESHDNGNFSKEGNHGASISSQEMESRIAALKSGSTNVKLVDGTGTSMDIQVQEAIKEYLDLEMLPFSRKGYTYFCRNCNVHFVQDFMFAHVLIKRHMNPCWQKMQSRESLNMKLQLLAFIQLAKPMDFSLTRVRSAIKKMEKMMKQKRSLKDVCGKLAKENSSIGTVSSVQPPGIAVQNSVPKDTEVKNVNEDGSKHLRNTIRIGDSVSVNLKEELSEAYGGNISDCELECEVCGVVFPIFNDDIGFSMDMHVQNDPQHCLATAVPVERDVQCVADPQHGLSTLIPDERETQCVAEASVSTSTVYGFPKITAGSSSLSKSKRQKIREEVRAEVLLLEEKYLDFDGNKTYKCTLCRATVRTDTQMFRHFISPSHFSRKWFENITYDELQLKLERLSALQYHGYACTAIRSAVQMIENTSTGIFNSAGQRLVKPFAGSKPAIIQTKVNTLVFVPSKVLGPETTNPSKCHESRPVVSVDKSIQGNPSLDSPVSSTVFYCVECKLVMHINNKKSHLSGKSHKEYASIFKEKNQ